MNFLEPMTPGPKTLGQRILEGRIPVAEALRYGMILADSIRRLHDAGFVHGAVSPASITLTTTGLELQPATPSSTRAITPYTAPEVIQGRPADIRSDIFSFATVLFEMLTGKRTFEGQTRASLANAITNSPTPTSGSPAVDKLLSGCLAKNPDARTQRMQKIMMELKLLSVAVRRSDGVPAAAASAPNGAPPSLRRDPQDPASDARDSQLEARIAARLQAHERTMAEMQRAMAEAVQSLRAQLNHVVVDLATAQQRAAFGGGSFDGLDDTATDRILGRVDHGFEAVNERIAHLERNVEEIRSHQDVFEHSVAADLVDIEQSIKLQASGIESARTAMSQTDDLVERVVEALESLQSTVIDQGDGASSRSAFVN